MRRTARRRLAPAVAMLLACALLAPSTGQAGGARTRTYAGYLSGTGVLARERGRVTVTLTLTPVGSRPAPAQHAALTVYSARITLRARACRRTAAHTARSCLSVSGSLRGEAIDDPPDPPVADVATKIKLTSLSGALHGLGVATARGEMWGTGFILRGTRTLALVIRARGRQFDLSGAGALVPGFQEP